MFWFGKKKEKERPYRLGFALSGGGARGFAHVGVLRAFEERGIKPDVLAGTSAGSIVAALYADGYAPQHIIKLFSELNVRELVDVTLPRNSLLKFDKFVHFLESKFHAKRIEDLQIPTLITVTDFDHGKSVFFDKGDLPIRVAASCAIPIVFAPIEIDGIHYVDGGVLCNLPATHLRDICDVVVGVNVSPLHHEQYEHNLLSIADRAYNFLSCGNVFPDIAKCDILIECENISDYRVFDLNEQLEIEQLGYQKALEVLDNLSPDKKNLLNI
ncbi:MAG: patatin-like phospholipase family protein [Bacteroidaceae bacterium]|nr:patatin-like phospholipase family protein [Bacteroidaceae bacterium]